MATRIRLQRYGKKGKAFFHIVIADQRSKRDGKFIEKLGVYNPTSNPATIDLNFDRTLHWVQTGAEPTETVRAILAYKGVLYKDHLLRGVKKGALTLEQAEAKFAAWMDEKISKIEGKKSGLEKSRAEAERKRLAAEREVNEARAAAIIAASQPVEVVAEVETEVPAEEENVAPPADATETPEAPKEESN